MPAAPSGNSSVSAASGPYAADDSASSPSTGMPVAGPMWWGSPGRVRRGPDVWVPLVASAQRRADQPVEERHGRPYDGGSAGVTIGARGADPTRSLRERVGSLRGLHAETALLRGRGHLHRVAAVGLAHRLGDARHALLDALPAQLGRDHEQIELA